MLRSDSLALVDLYNSTNGPSWTTKVFWLQSGAKVSSWSGVTISGNRVVSLVLSSNNLTGTLPASIGNLTGLTQLNLGSNNLSGSIPSTIGNLVNLKFLLLRNNQLTGSIPSAMGTLVALEELRLEQNQLSGSIPTAIQNNKALKYLVLSGNALTGNIPPAIGELENLIELKLSRNQFTGEIPSSITNLLLLEHLDVQDNNLTGTIPSAIGSMSRLTDLLLGNEAVGVHVNKNRFTGTLPTSISNLALLETLKANDNALEGSIPLLTSSSKLKVVDLSNNRFTALPVTIGLSALESFDVRYNLLTFEDLYFIHSQNLKDIFLYYPQQDESYQVKPDTIDFEVNSLVTLTVPDNTLNNEYVWSFNDLPVLPLVNSPTFQIPALTKQTMGTYTCEVFNVNIQGTYIYTFKVNATAELGGVLYDEFGDPALAGSVDLYKVTGGAYERYPTPAAIGPLDENGNNYRFTGIVLENYIVRGTVTSSNPLVLPTWHEQSIYWEDALPIALETNTYSIDINAQDWQGPPAEGEGPGSIGGTFYEEIPDDGRIEKKSKVKDAPVSVRRVDESGRGSDTELVLIDYTYTDEEGKFFFDNLIAAEYLLNIQYPGYPMDETSFINIPIVDNLFERHVEVIAEIIANKIVVRKLVITGWEQETQSIHAYPNPSIETVFITGISQQGVQFTLTNSNGAIMPVQMQWNEAMQRWELNVKEFTNGMYFLQVMAGRKSNRLRIVIK